MLYLKSVKKFRFLKNAGIFLLPIGQKMSSFHVHQCVVHQPNSVRRKSKHFHNPPRTITEENQKFWKGDAPLGGSIYKDCWTLFLNSSPGESFNFTR
jgi:hypothetical protein